MMVGNNFFLSQQLGLALLKCGLKVSVAESCTGGGLAKEITNVAGSSEWFDCGFVTYSNTAKIEILGVSTKTLQQHGAVSAETAREMAMGALQRSHADIALSTTGIAGPSGGTKEKPVGMVWFGMAYKEERCETELKYFSSGRKQICFDATEFALQWLLCAISKIRQVC